MTKATRPSLAILCAVLVASCSPAFSPSPAMPQRASSSAHPQVTNFKSIFSFDGPDGGFPSASLLVFGNKLFGTNEGVGAGPPTVYDVTSSGREYVLYKFYSGSGGGRSLSPLVRVNGVFYGTTTNGGDYGDGSVFAVTESGQVRELTSFYGDGIEPMGGLFPYKGALYGTTSSGGNYNAGTVLGSPLLGTSKRSTSSERAPTARVRIQL